MNDDPNPNRFPQQQAKRKHPNHWEPDLNPNRRGGQNIGPESDERVTIEWNAFHLRKRGLDLGGVNDEELKQLPVLSDDERLKGEF